MRRYLILGNGAAGVTAAEEVRRADPSGEITLVSPEQHPMYSRPGLAYVLLKEIPPHQVLARKPEWYAERSLQLVAGEAVGLDTAQHQVRLANGLRLPYDRLLIATGARAVGLPYPGADLDGVVYLDTLAGTLDLLKRAKRARRAVVVGGGITALELAEGLAHHKIETHYCVRRGTLWSAVFNPQESDLLAERLAAHGVILHYFTEITRVLGDRRGRVTGVELENGQTLPCDLVGAGIGVRPQIDLARNAGLHVDRALMVDEQLQTTAPDVYAAGDCAQTWDRWTQRHTLDILWPSAVAAGRVAGRNLAGAAETYARGVPFNACLLFGLHLTVIGQLGNAREAGEPEVFQHISRGSSEVWAARPVGYASAWAQTGLNTVRLTLSGARLVGALVMGNQTLADPLRDLIEWQADLTPLRPYLQAGGAALTDIIQRFWRLQQLARRAGHTQPATPAAPRA
jgi:NAD(P)H-nitrite reductase large subunit